jgi:hypothetical protein
MKKPCADCGTPIRVSSVKVHHGHLLSGTCPKCSAGHISVSGNPAEVLFVSMYLAMHFMEMSHNVGKLFGMDDPFEEDPGSIFELVEMSRKPGWPSPPVDLSQLQ